MRTVSKNKFLLCFRPVVDIDAMLESKVAVDSSDSSRFACIPVAYKHEMRNSETKSVCSHQGTPSFSKHWIMRQTRKRTLSRVIKAVVLETILNRRARNKNGYARNKNGYRQDSSGSKCSYSTYTETKAPESPLSTSSSSSPLVSESKNLSKYKEKQNESSDRDPLEKQKEFEFYGICLILISLAFTVFMGKLFGIILTSIWLCFFSRWDSSYRMPKEAPKFSKSQTKVYKNRGHNGRSAQRELP